MLKLNTQGKKWKRLKNKRAANKEILTFLF